MPFFACSCGFKPNNVEWREVITAAAEAAMKGDGAITAQEVPPLQPVFSTSDVYERSQSMMGCITVVSCAARACSGRGQVCDGARKVDGGQPFRMLCRKGRLSELRPLAQVAECLGLKEGQQEVDLHGLSGLEARAAVLCVLCFVQQRAAQGHPLEPRLTFITGPLQHCVRVAVMHCRDLNCTPSHC